MALIVVEGPDLVGKSTFVDALRRAIRRSVPGDVQVLHRGPPRDHPLREYEAPLMAYRPSAGRHVICDRWHVGERVYPTLHARATHMDVAVWHHVEMFLRSRGALLVHLTAEDETLLERRAGRDELPHGLNIRARDLFRRWTVASSLHHMTLHAETVADDVDGAADLVLQSALNAAVTAARLDSIATYVGPHLPSLLLMGDVRANGPQATHLTLDGDVPAFMPFRSTSGHYLLDALGGDVTRFGIGLANACDVDDPAHVWKTLGYPPVVALGRNADKMLTKADVPHGAVAHPQFWRRFFNRYSAEYRLMITDTDAHKHDLINWKPADSWAMKESVWSSS